MLKKLGPYKITLIYIILGFLWIFFSDILVQKLFNPEVAEKIQTIKGTTFIALTSGLVFYLTLIYQKQLLIGRKQLLKNEKRYRKLINAAPVGIIVHQNGRIIFANEKILEVIGASSMREVIGERIMSFVYKDYWQELRIMEKELLQNQIVSPQEMKLVRRNDHKIIDAELSSVLIEYQGKIAVQTILQDITNRKDTERELRQNEAKLKEAQQLGKMGSWEWTIGQQRTVWSDQMFNIFPRDISEGQPTVEELISYITPDDREIFLELSRKAIHNSEPYNYDFRIFDKDQNIRYVNDVCKPITDETGTVVRLEGITVDITDRKKAELNLKESEANLKEAQKLGKTGHWELDVDTRELTWSEQMYSIYHDSIHASCPKIDDLTAHIHPEDQADWRQSVENLLTEGKPYNIVFRIKDKDENTCFLNEIAEPVYNEQGEIIRAKGVVIDITERKKAEIKQQESEQKYRKLVETIPDGVALHDLNGKYLFMNKAAAGFLKGKPSSFIGKTINEVHNREAARFFMWIIRHVQKSKTGWQGEAQLGHHWYIINVEPLYQDQQEGMRILSVVTDITEQKNTQLQLEKIRENLLRAQRIAKIGSWNLEVTTNKMMWSDMMYRIMGVEKNLIEPSLHHLYEWIHPEDRRIVQQTFSDILMSHKKEKNSELEYRLLTPEGKELNIFQIVEVTFNKSGKVVRLDGTIQDISERIKAEKALQKAFAQLESYTNALNRSALVAITDLNGILLHVNNKFCELSHFNKEEFLGEPFNFMNRRFHSNAFYKRMFQTLRKGETWRGEIKNKGKDGHIFWLDMVVNPLYNEEGLIDRFLAISYEITDRKLNEEKLARTNRELETFLYKASHDLKGPLTTMNGLINITRHETKEPHLQHLLKLMEERAHHLRKTLDELVEISNIRQSQLHFTPIDFDQVISEVIDLLKTTYKDEDIIIHTDVDIQEPPFYCDKHLIELIFIHMLDNSIKYKRSDSGVIEIKVRSAGGQLKINISDKGQGIPLHVQEKVFDMYFRGNERSKGAGLGLYIVKTIVERLNGEVFFTSKLGEGTTFAISIPRFSEMSSERAA